MRRRIVLALAVAAALGAAAALAQALRAPPAALARVDAGSAAAGPDGTQTATLVLRGGAYAPNLVTARAGAPLRLRVRTEDRSACATRLLAPDLGIDLALVPGGTAEVVVPSPARGRWVFTCEARMVKGVIAVE
jgi:plastocyanin domain-containing protein